MGYSENLRRRRLEPLCFACLMFVGCGTSNVDAPEREVPGAPSAAVPPAARDSSPGGSTNTAGGGAGSATLPVVPATPATAPTTYHSSPEATWLADIGKGAAQTNKVCMRGGQDPIAAALCATPAPAIQSLMDLHKALGIPETDPQTQNNGQLQQQQGATRLIGMTANSASLVSRSVNALNPRVVIGVVPDQDGTQAERRRQFAVGFVRGEPFAELAGYDAAANRLNFYLLAYQPNCAGEHCEPKELLTQAVEHEWQGWTLYQAEDLANTPLDCLSCHQPGGANAPRRFLMRQLQNPWMHWTPQEPRNINCGNQRNNDAQVSYVTPTLFDTFRDARTGEARYAGLELATLGRVRAGRQLQTFIESFESAMGANNQRGGTQVGETNPFPSRTILSDSLCDESQANWATYRANLADTNRPVPFYLPDVLDPLKRDAAAKDYAGFLASRPEADEFEVVTGLMSDAATAAVGFRAAEDATPEDVLTQMCSRCHNDTVDPSLTRSRFNALSLDRLTREAALEAIERIALTRDEPKLMPPRRFGELSPAIIERLRGFLTTKMASAPSATNMP